MTLACSDNDDIPKRGNPRRPTYVHGSLHKRKRRWRKRKITSHTPFTTVKGQTPIHSNTGKKYTKSFPDQLSFLDEQLSPTIPSDLRTKMIRNMKTWATESDINGSLRFPPQNLDSSIEARYTRTCGTYLMTQRPLRFKHSEKHASESILNPSPIFSFVICCKLRAKKDSEIHILFFLRNRYSSPTIAKSPELFTHTQNHI